MTAYGSAADVLANLPRDCRQTRTARRLSLREAGVEIGVSHHAVWCLERGRPTHALTMILVLRWLETNTGTRHPTVTRSPRIRTPERVTPQ